MKIVKRLFDKRANSSSARGLSEKKDNVKYNRKRKKNFKEKRGTKKLKKSLIKIDDRMGMYATHVDVREIK